MPPEPTENPELEALVQTSVEGNDKLDSIEGNTEAQVLEQTNTTQAIRDLETPLEAIALNTMPKEVQKIQLIPFEDPDDEPEAELNDSDTAQAILALWKANRGPKGKQGDRGEKGDKGDTGEPGFSPRKGIEYDDGAKGEKGDRGEKGEKGDSIVGPTGPKGEKGERGEKGVPGKNGNDGSPDTPEEIAAKVNTLKKSIDFKVLKNVPDNLGRNTPGGGGGQDITVLDETTVLTSVLKQLQFIGDGVTAVSINDGVIVVTIPGGGGSGANIATETVTATDAGSNNVNIDLTQLANAWTSVEFVSRNGVIQDKNKWSIIGDTLTLTGAVATNSFQLQYQYA